MPVAVAAAPRTTVDGTFYRHTGVRRPDLVGTAAGGRWGPAGAYVVLYLGRPPSSVVVEAYRHLIESVIQEPGAPTLTPAMIAPRKLVTCTVTVDDVLDLRTPEAQLAVGLTEADLASDVGDYERCRAVARATYQLGLHGIVAPAATGLGETLALFEQHLTGSEIPRLVFVEPWDSLPADPRILRAVDPRPGDR
jgi:RES domain-containing protein